MRRHARLADFGLAKDQVDVVRWFGHGKNGDVKHQWIGLRENLQETMVFTIKYRGFRLKFSHHPILCQASKKYNAANMGIVTTQNREKHWDSMKNWLVVSNIFYFSIY